LYTKVSEGQTCGRTKSEHTKCYGETLKLTDFFHETVSKNHYESLKAMLVGEEILLAEMQ